MSPGGGTVVSENVLSANKSAPANERTFTEGNETVDAPRSFKEARTNVEIINDISLMSIQKSNPSRYNDKFSSTVKTIQPAECT